MNAKVNPLSRRPKNKRLVMAVRGAAGVGKSHFAASLADAGLGRLCFFDAERKARLLAGASGATPKFDALEIHHPDELPEFISWALEGEGKAQNYGCYALDSWTLYFGRKYRQSLEAIRAQRADPTAQPSAEQLQADQLIYQEVLRRLCVDSGACVVITDQIAAKGKEDREENELGQVLPMTLGGLEYYVDVMIELSLRLEGFEQVRIARVIKSNSSSFPIGLELKNPSFKDFLARMEDLENAKEEFPEFLKPIQLISSGKEADLAGLLQQGEEVGLDKTQVLTAARHYHGVSSLEQLKAEHIADLLKRLNEKYPASEKRQKLSKVA